MRYGRFACDGPSAGRSVNLLGLLGDGKDELVALLLAGALDLDLDRLIHGGAAEAQALVNLVGHLAGEVIGRLLAVLRDDHGVLTLLGVFVLQPALGTEAVTLDGDR